VIVTRHGRPHVRISPAPATAELIDGL
jgi:antitoxin (DNA-binding transcriptional repressor) of toxin-antitoxin stability system